MKQSGITRCATSSALVVLYCLLSSAVGRAATTVDSEGARAAALQFVGAIQVPLEDTRATVQFAPDDSKLKCPDCWQVVFPSGEQVRIRASDGQIIWYLSESLHRLTRELVAIRPMERNEAVETASGAMMASGCPPDTYRLATVRFAMPGHQSEYGYWDIEWTRTFNGVPFNADFARVFIESSSGKPFLFNKTMASPLPSSLDVKLEQAEAERIATDVMNSMLGESRIAAWSELRIVSPNEQWGSTPDATLSRLAWVVNFSTEIVYVDAQTGEVLGGARALLAQPKSGVPSVISHPPLSVARSRLYIPTPEGAAESVAAGFLLRLGREGPFASPTVKQAASECPTCWLARFTNGDEVTVRVSDDRSGPPLGHVVRYFSQSLSQAATSVGSQRRIEKAQAVSIAWSATAALSPNIEPIQLASADFEGGDNQKSFGGTWLISWKPIGIAQNQAGRFIRVKVEASTGAVFYLENRLEMSLSTSSSSTGQVLLLGSAGFVLVGIVVFFVLKLKKWRHTHLATLQASKS